VPVPIHSITFWLNAFIPRDISGATVRLRDGEYKGLTVLRGPRCYLTDQRDFSSDPGARSRMHSLVIVNFEREVNLAQSHRCDELIECDPMSGDVLRKGHGSTSKMNFCLLASAPDILVQINCRYSDVFNRVGHGINEIEYNGTIKIDSTVRSIDIDLMICLFPSFEGYAAIDDSPGAVLFRHAPPAGILAVGPPHGANRRIRSHLDVDARFGSNDGC